jgi:hypothetical protein
MQIFGAKLWFVATSSAQLCHSECVASIEMCGLNEHAVVVMDQEYFTGLEGCMYHVYILPLTLANRYLRNSTEK